MIHTKSCHKPPLQTQWRREKTTLLPPTIPALIEPLIDHILAKLGKILDPYEQAFFVMPPLSAHLNPMSSKPHGEKSETVTSNLTS